MTVNPPTVGVFCNSYLPVSQTFVRDHLMALRRYHPVVVAKSLVSEGLTVEGVPVIVPHTSRAVAMRIARRLSRSAAHSSIRKAITRSRANLIHAHFGTSGVLVRGACQQLGLPLIVTFHGYDVTIRVKDRGATRLGRNYGARRFALLRDADAIITVSQYLAGRLVQMGANPSKVHVIPCGVDTDRFDETPVPQDRRVLFVGRLVDKKGCEDLLRAVAARARSTQVLIIGDGPLRGRLTQVADELGVAAEFVGSQPHERVRDEIRRAQVVALPSRTAADGDQEGLPVAALEAAASGRPVVGYRHSGIPEAVVDGHTGLLTDEGDIAGLARHLEVLLNDPDQCQRMGVSARTRAIQLFDLRKTTARIEQVYDRVLGSNVRQRHTSPTAVDPLLVQP